MTHRQIANALKKLTAKGIRARVEQTGAESDYAALVISGDDVALAMHVAPVIRTTFCTGFGTEEVAFLATMRGKF